MNKQDSTDLGGILMTEFIKDRKQFDKLLQILPDLQKDEVYFMSLSARNKYLTDDERAFYHLGRTEMFSRTVVKSKDNFDYGMSKMYASLLYKRTKSKIKFPEKSLIAYVNINPSSTIKAYEMFVNDMNKELFGIIAGLDNNKNVPYASFKKIERNLLNCIQKSKSRRVYIDIDMDVKNESYIKHLIAELVDKVEFYPIKTKSGYHCLIKAETLKNSGVRIDKIVQSLDVQAKEEQGEVIINTNQMIPIPGTLQSDELVMFYEY